MTLPHESIPGSMKTFFSQAHAITLRKRKYEALNLVDDTKRCPWEELRLFKKKENSNVSRRNNFVPQFSGYVAPSEYRSRRYGRW